MAMYVARDGSYGNADDLLIVDDDFILTVPDDFDALSDELIYNLALKYTFNKFNHFAQTVLGWSAPSPTTSKDKT